MNLKILTRSFVISSLAFSAVSLAATIRSRVKITPKVGEKMIRSTRPGARPSEKLTEAFTVPIGILAEGKMLDRRKIDTLGFDEISYVESEDVLLLGHYWSNMDSKGSIHYAVKVNEQSIYEISESSYRNARRTKVESGKSSFVTEGIISAVNGDSSLLDQLDESFRNFLSRLEEHPVSITTGGQGIHQLGNSGRYYVFALYDTYYGNQYESFFQVYDLLEGRFVGEHFKINAGFSGVRKMELSENYVRIWENNSAEPTYYRLSDGNKVSLFSQMFSGHENESYEEINKDSSGANIVRIYKISAETYLSIQGQSVQVLDRNLRIKKAKITYVLNHKQEPVFPVSFEVTKIPNKKVFFVTSEYKIFFIGE